MCDLQKIFNLSISYLIQFGAFFYVVVIFFISGSNYSFRIHVDTMFGKKSLMMFLVVLGIKYTLHPLTLGSLLN